MGKQDFLANKVRREAGETPVKDDKPAFDKEAVAESVPQEHLKAMAATRARAGNEPDIFNKRISTQEEFDWMRDVLLLINKDQGALDLVRMDLTKPHRDAAAAINDTFRPFNAWCDEAKAGGKARMGEFVTDQKKREQVAQAEAEETARKAQAAIEKRAEKAEAAGHVEKADELAEQASQVQVQDVTTDKQKGEKTVWDYDEKDAREFIRFAANDPYLVNALKIDKVFVKKYLTECNDKNMALPGLKIKTNVTFALR